jgi:hypothetical protein
LRVYASRRVSLSLRVSALKGPCLGVPHEHVLARDAHVGELDKTIIDPMPALRDPPSAAHVRQASQTCLCVSTAACHSVCVCVCVCVRMVVHGQRKVCPGQSMCLCMFV